MQNIPPLRFAQQDDNALPIPNLHTSLLIDKSVEMTCAAATETGDLIVAHVIGENGKMYNLSYEVEENEAELRFPIPKSIITRNSGTNVFLLLRIRRGIRDVFFSPMTTVSIDAGVIVVPPPGIHWDFSDGTRQGWNVQSVYAGIETVVQNSSIAFNVTSTRTEVLRSHVITRPVLVRAGVTYKFSFSAISGAAINNTSRLSLTINGKSLDNEIDVENLTQGQPQTGSGEYTSPVSGVVQLGIVNKTVPRNSHIFLLGDIKMTPAPGLN